MSSFLVLLRHSLRALRRAPGFSLSVIATLALALGPGVALLSLAEQIFWRPLPLPQPERLVVLDPPQRPFRGRTSQWSQFSMVMSYPEYRRLAAWEAGPFEGVAARAPVRLALDAGGATEEIQAELVSGNYFDVLGVRAAEGRLLAPSDDLREGDHPLAVLSWGSWQRRFGGDPEIAGRAVSVNGRAFTVVGVAQREFRSLELEFAPELWLPMAMKPVATPLWDHLDEPQSRWLNAVARLRPGLDAASAEKLVNDFYPQVSAEVVEAFKFDADARQRFLERRLALLPGGRGRSNLRGETGRALLAILALVALLFALACANLANLFAARATRLERDFTVRLALGSTRSELARRILAEAALLSLAAVTAGAFIAFALPRWLPDLLSPTLGDLAPAASPLLLAGAVALVVAATLGAGLLPALTATRGEVAERLRSSAAAALGGRGAARVRVLLVGVQVVLSTAILIGAGLLVRSLVRLADRDPGFRTAGVLTFSLDPRLTGLSLEAERQLVDRVESELARLPGVDSVARAEIPLLTNTVASTTLNIVGRPAAEGERHEARLDYVTPDYFRTLGIPLRAGRTFTAADRRDGARVAIVNERLVRENFAGLEPLGQRLAGGADRGEVEIVGVVGDVLSANLREQSESFVYFPYDQQHAGDASVFYLRTAGPPSALIDSVRRRLLELAPGVPVEDLEPLADQARESLALERATAGIAAALGGVAALLSAVGLYGVLAYTVDARRRELAVRAALGAAPTGLGRWVLAHAAPPVAAGLAAGAAVAFAGSRLLERLLFGVPPHDPATFATVVVGLLVVACAATLVPTLRALRVQPALVLRED